MIENDFFRYFISEICNLCSESYSDMLFVQEKNLDFEISASINSDDVNIIGKVGLGAFSYIVSGILCNVIIGRYCSIGHNVTIGLGNHPIEFFSTSPVFFDYSSKMVSIANSFYNQNILMSRKSIDDKSTKIGNDVWIGGGAVVLAGVEIGDGAIIGANSVVTKDVLPYSIVAGNPAKFLRFRFSEDQCIHLSESKWWNKDPEDLSKIEYTSINEFVINVVSCKDFFPNKVNTRDFKNVL